MESSEVSYEAMDASLKASGYTLAKESPRGSRLYEATWKASYRVSHLDPNPATAAWMKRCGVQDVRVAGERAVLPGELPEFGLERSDDYHSDTEYVTKTMLSVAKESLVDYYHMFVTGLMPKKVPTRRMKIGTICHSVLLEHKRIDEACIAFPYSCLGKNDQLISAKAKEFEAKVAKDGLIAVKEDMIEVIERTIANARASKFGALLDLHSDKAKYEHRVNGELCGLKVKCKPDIHIVLSDQIIVPDLKFGALKPDDWKRVSNRFFYWMQQAMYTAILEQHYKLPVSWSFWAFETEFPYRVEPKTYGPRSIEIAASETRNQLKRLKQAYDTGIWKDDFQNEIELDPWSIGDARNQEETPTENTEYEHKSYESDEFTE